MGKGLGEGGGGGGLAVRSLTTVPEGEEEEEVEEERCVVVSGADFVLETGSRGVVENRFHSLCVLSY